LPIKSSQFLGKQLQEMGSSSDKSISNQLQLYSIPEISLKDQ
jgi:hypothetical protein